MAKKSGGDKARWVMELVDRLTRPMRTARASTMAMRKATEATKSSADSASAAMGKLGAATQAAGSKALKGANDFKKAAGTIRAAQASASFATLAGRGPGTMLARGQLGAVAPKNTGNAFAFAGGRKMTRGVSARAMYGPILDRSAQGAAAEPMGPKLDRKAQKLGFLDRINVATKGLRDWNSSAGETIAKWGEMRAAFMGTPFGMVAKGAAGVVAALVSIGVEVTIAVAKIAALTYALGALAAAWLTLKVAEKAAFAERAQKSLTALTGSAEAGLAAYKQGRRIAKELGTDSEHTIQQLIQLRAAQFSLGQSETLIKLSADLQTVTGEAEAAERAIRAITQIKAKGKMQAEELMQLSEAGLSLELVYEELGKIMNKTRPELQKLMQKGKIDAVNGVQAIQNAIMHKLHETKPGEVARQMAATTLTGLVMQLQNLPGNLMLDIGELIDIKPMKDVAQKVLDAFNDIDRGEAAGFFDRLIEGAAELVNIGLEFGRGFGDSFDEIRKAMGLTFSPNGIREFARTAGSWLAKFFALATRWLHGVIELFNDLGKVWHWLGEHSDTFWRISEGMARMLPVVGAVLGIFLDLTRAVLKFMEVKDEALGIKKVPKPPPIPLRFPFTDPALQQKKTLDKLTNPSMGSTFPNLGHPDRDPATGAMVPNQAVWQTPNVAAPTPVPKEGFWGTPANQTPKNVTLSVGKVDVMVPPGAQQTPATFGRFVRDEVAKALSEFADRQLAEQ